MASLLFCGCQSAAQSDLISREMRLQEDKIYALQDYLSEYQQLLCQYRAENEALKERMQDGASSPSLAPRSGTGRSLAPPNEAPRAPSRGSESTTPDLPVPDLDIPNLNDRSSNDDLKVTPATHEASTNQSASHPAGEAASAAGPAERVWLSGEVIANEAGGPRLVVDVAPLTSAGRSTSFAGPVSLMILEPTENGPPKNIARWDYATAEAKSATDNAPDRHAMRFRMELPADTAVDRPAELWVRLVHENGVKLLANVPLDLRRPHGFASAPFESKTIDSKSTDNSTAPTSDSKQQNLVILASHTEEGWAIARPGETVIAPASDSKKPGEWRITSEPMPMITVASATARPSPLSPIAEKPAAESQTASTPPMPSATRSVPRPWSPERALTNGADPKAKTAISGVKPPSPTSSSPTSWSPTR